MNPYLAVHQSCPSSTIANFAHEKSKLKQLASRKTGNDLLSQAVSRQVSSALGSLTAVFGMGTGVSSPLLSPDFFF